MKLLPLVQNLLLENKLTLDKSIPKGEFGEEKIQLTNKFIDFVCSQLKIKEDCDIILTWNRTNGMTTGGYNPSNNKIYILIKGRLCVDFYRSISHELKHQEQRELGLLTPESGKDGDKFENDANSFAGVIMRKFSKKYPQIYDL